MARGKGGHPRMRRAPSRAISSSSERPSTSPSTASCPSTLSMGAPVIPPRHRDSFPTLQGSRRGGGAGSDDPRPSAMFFVQLAEMAAEAERLRAVIAARYGLAPHDAADPTLPGRHGGGAARAARGAGRPSRPGPRGAPVRDDGGSRAGRSRGALRPALTDARLDARYPVAPQARSERRPAMPRLTAMFALFRFAAAALAAPPT